MPLVFPEGSMEDNTSTSDEITISYYYNPLYEGSVDLDNPSDTSIDVLISSDDEQTSDSISKIEEKVISDRLTTRSAAFIMLLLFHFFRKMNVSSVIPSETLDFFNQRADLLQNITSNQPLLCDVLNSVDLNKQSLDSILDQANRSEFCVRETAPNLYAGFTGENGSTQTQSADSNTECNTTILNKYKLEQLKFSKIVQRYRYLLNTYKSFITSVTAENKTEEKHILRDFFNYIREEESNIYGVVRERFNNLEYKLRNKTDEEKINILQKELYVLDEIDIELNRYNEIFQKLIFYPYGISQSYLENKLVESAEKLEILASDMYAACVFK